MLAKTTQHMKKTIQIFKNNAFGTIRTMTNEKGETFFVGKDVAMALGYKNPNDALCKHVDEEDKGTVAIRDTAYETRAVIINESGLYSLYVTGDSKCHIIADYTHQQIQLPAIRLRLLPEHPCDKSDAASTSL